MEPVTFDTCLTCVLLVVMNVLFFWNLLPSILVSLVYCWLLSMGYFMEPVTFDTCLNCVLLVVINVFFYGTCYLRYLSHLCIVGCYQWVILWNLLPSILVSLVYCWLLSMGYFMEPVTFDTCLTCVLLVVINGLFYGTCYLRYLSHLCIVGCYQCVIFLGPVTFDTCLTFVLLVVINVLFYGNLLPSILVSLVYCWLLSMCYFMEPVTFDTCLTFVLLIVICVLFYGTCYLRYLSHLCIVDCYQCVILWNLLPSILVSLVYCWLLSVCYFMEPVSFDTCLTCVLLVVISVLFYGTCYLRYLSHLCIVGCYQCVILWNLLPSILVSLVYCWLLSMGYFMEHVTFDTCLTCVLLIVINGLFMEPVTFDTCLSCVLLVVINGLFMEPVTFDTCLTCVLLVVINGLFYEPLTFDTCLTCVLLAVINGLFYGTCYLRYLSHLCIVGCYQWVIYGTCYLRYLSHLCIVGSYQWVIYGTCHLR